MGPLYRTRVNSEDTVSSGRFTSVDGLAIDRVSSDGRHGLIRGMAVDCGYTTVAVLVVYGMAVDCCDPTTGCMVFIMSTVTRGYTVDGVRADGGYLAVTVLTVLVV
jgi:hypothetical protein